MPNEALVRVHMRNGVCFIDEVPPGVTVEVVNYDVPPTSPESDENGRPCQRYSVEGECAKLPPSSEGINPNVEWIPPWSTEAVNG